MDNEKIYPEGWIYIIQNKENINHFYLGSTINIKSRFNRHKNLLNKKKHHSHILQKAWNKYGEQGLEFIKLNMFKNITSKQLVEVEDFMLKLTLPTYNILKEAYAFSQLGIDRSVAKRIKEFIITKPNGEIINIKNLQKFCRENDLNVGCMHNVNIGVMESHKGYKCQAVDGSYIPYINKKYKCTGNGFRKWMVISPNGENFIINNLKNFCEGNNLLYKQVWKFARDNKSWNGWIFSLSKNQSHRIMNTSEEGLKNKKEARAKKYIVKTPTGVLIKVYNMSDFCKENNLRASHMYQIASALCTRKTHKGYTCWYDNE